MSSSSSTNETLPNSYSEKKTIAPLTNAEILSSEMNSSNITLKDEGATLSSSSSSISSSPSPTLSTSTSNNPTIPFPLPCLPGETLISSAPTVNGFVAITNYRFAIIHMKSSFLHRYVERLQVKKDFEKQQLKDDDFENENSCLCVLKNEKTTKVDKTMETIGSVRIQAIPLRTIWKSEVVELIHYRVLIKTGRMIKITFADNRQCLNWHEMVIKQLVGLIPIKTFFAFTFKQNLNENSISIEKNEIYKLFLSERECSPPDMEFNRMGFCHKLWKITDVNEKFSVCLTYPVRHIVPRNITDQSIIDMAKFRQSNRFPTVIWRSQQTGAVLLRCAQPCVGLIGSRNKEDENFLSSVLECCQKDPQATALLSIGNLSYSKRLLIVDARHYSAAFYNCFRGGGFENVQNYANVDIEWKNLPNMHSVRSSFEKLNLCIHSCPDQWLSALEGSEWLNYLGQLLRVSYDIAQVIHTKGCPVMIHCTDGWDRTPQLTSLVQILLDPFYRTIKGFQLLLEREWLDYGHKFSDRCGLRINSLDMNEVSPIFLQFLDCVYQLCNQYPAEFEFNEIFLIKLGNHAYSGLFGTFLCNSHQERLQNNVYDSTCSIWSFLDPAHNGVIKNYLFKKSRVILIPSWSARDLLLWRGMYFDDTVSHELPIGHTPSPSSMDHVPLWCATDGGHSTSHVLRSSSVACEVGDKDTQCTSSSLLNTNADVLGGQCTFLDCHNNPPTSMSRSLSLPSIEALTLNLGCRPIDVNSLSPAAVLRDHHNSQLHLENKSLHKMNSATDDFNLSFKSNSSLTPTLPQPPFPKPRTRKASPPIMQRDFTNTNQPNPPMNVVTSASLGSSPTAPSGTCSPPRAIASTDYASAVLLDNIKAKEIKQMREYFRWIKVILNIHHPLVVELPTNCESLLHSNFTPWKVIPEQDWDGFALTSTRINPYTLYIVDLQKKHQVEKEQLENTCQRYKEETLTIQQEIERYKSLLNGSTAAVRGSVVNHRSNGTNGDRISVSSSSSSMQINESFNSGSFVNVKNTSIVMWIPDHMANVCGLCPTRFTSIVRRHHCRNCGHIFCSNCSNYFIPLPQQNLSVPTRVCFECYKKCTTSFTMSTSSELTITTTTNQFNTVTATSAAAWLSTRGLFMNWNGKHVSNCDDNNDGGMPGICDLVSSD